jgi:hypothetical protein
VCLWRSRLRRLGRLGGTSAAAPPPSTDACGDLPPSLVQRLAFAALLLFCLTIPSNWTQDVVARYGKRHPGLVNTAWYPRIDTAPPRQP